MQRRKKDAETIQYAYICVRVLNSKQKHPKETWKWKTSEEQKDEEIVREKERSYRSNERFEDVFFFEAVIT